MAMILGNINEHENERKREQHSLVVLQDYVTFMSLTDGVLLRATWVLTTVRRLLLALLAMFGCLTWCLTTARKISDPRACLSESQAWT